MSLPKRITDKRKIDPVQFLMRANGHLVQDCIDDSFEDSSFILRTCLFLLNHAFQQVLFNSFLDKESRRKHEIATMRAALAVHEVNS